MLGWLNKKTVFTGSVLFRGPMPPRAEEFAFLQKRGIRVAREKPKEGVHWGLRLSHPEWGEARLFCLPKQIPSPREAVQYDWGLTEPDKEAISAARSGVHLRHVGRRGHVLHDRKSAFRFLEAVMGDDGVAAADHLSQHFWSPEALRQELRHDADLDIEQITTFHAVTAGSEDDSMEWLHSHGLGEIGFVDFDVLNPSEDMRSPNGGELLRAISFAIVEGKVIASTPRFDLARPGGDVRFVDVSNFVRLADPASVALRGGGGDIGHEEKRAVVCDPASRFWGRWSRKVRPSRFFSRPLNDGMVINFSTEATQLMAERARGTYQVFQAVFAEVAEFEFPALAKLGFETDGGGADDKEHLWFQVHEPLDREIDGTLVNQPFRVARLKEGQRGRHAVDRLSDWTIMTPIGNVTPRQMTTLRLIRANRDKLRTIMIECRAGRDD